MALAVDLGKAYTDRLSLEKFADRIIDAHVGDYAVFAWLAELFGLNAIQRAFPFSLSFLSVCFFLETKILLFEI